MEVTSKNIAVAGNTLVSERTLTSVMSIYKNSIEAFPLKIIKALQAGQAAGGDIRGMKSAALKVAKGQSSGKYWNDVIYDLRVEESADPLQELERLYYVAEAYSYINSAESANDPNEALELYTKALELDPNNAEIMFWMARANHSLGNSLESEKLRNKIRTINGNWDEYWMRLDEVKS